ncbi:hypothetical protein C8A01DRAFT_14512 [Parachaetomium inaequale]|uniref:Uncharacterized protein n=1 Tax=Parachaetomium inaequale TaxID=2588326 RepID=A0AAN6PKR9_9PEZI|nr:hypothetical protein C8A01DRAFT_14512 [Parachaetomium inaequale]
MPRSVHFILPGRERRASERPATCIVSNGVLNVCGRAAAEGRDCPEPVCADHLCQYRRSNGHSCKRTPLRLAHGDVYTTGGWFPDTEQSVNCARHERYNCVALINGAARCPGMKTHGRDYCSAHAATPCKWKSRDGSLDITDHDGYRCPKRRSPSTVFCRGHRCVWKSDKHIQCHGISYPNTVGGVCTDHICMKGNCGNGALNGADRCSEHVCAFQPPGQQPADFPVCGSEPVEGQPFCETHDQLVRWCAQMMEGQNRWLY